MKGSVNNTRRIAVIYGGRSVEHEISIITACLAKGYFSGEIVSVYLDRDNRAYLVGNSLTPRDHVGKKFAKQVVFLTGEHALGIVRGKRVVKLPIDVAVNCCHGLCGEDGCVAALCKMSGIPLVGSDVGASALAMDKVLCKQALAACGFPVVKGVCVTAQDDPFAATRELKYPLIVKPAMLGSSIGVALCRNQQQLQTALQTAFNYCNKALVEEALEDFFELNCAAMRVEGNVQTSAVERPVTVHELLTFEDKYIGGGKGNGSVQFDSDSVQFGNKDNQSAFEAQCEQAKRLTAEIYEKLFFGGVIRVDYLVNNTTGKLYVNEINTTPGSLAFGLWQGAYSRTRYGEALVDQAIADYREMQSYVYTFDSGVLTAGGVKK